MTPSQNARSVVMRVLISSHGTEMHRFGDICGTFKRHRTRFDERLTAHVGNMFDFLGM